MEATEEVTEEATIVIMIDMIEMIVTIERRDKKARAIVVIVAEVAIRRKDQKEEVHLHLQAVDHRINIIFNH